MHDMKKFFKGAVFGVASILLMSALPAGALTLQPVIIDGLSASPGETISSSVKVTNEANVPITFRMTSYDAEPGDDTGFPVYRLKTAESTLPNWINNNFDKEITLGANESKVVLLVIQVPKDAEPGGHYAGVAFGRSGAGPEGVGAGVTGQAAVNIALNVKGATVERGELMAFTTADEKTKYDKLPIEFTVKVNNSGNRHFKPTGTINITNMTGKNVASLSVNTVSSGGNVLPRSNRSFNAKWDGGFAFGKYTAHLALSMGKAGSAQAEYSFWVLPTGLLILWLVIALIIILILVLLIKNIMMGMTKKPAA